jgi:tRNA threonylcarbamoyladenosine biosynthesis protein TsaE
VTQSPAPLALDTASVVTRSAQQTRDLAASLAQAAQPGDRLALVGPLGAGKTQFAKGFAAGLGVHEVVNSPSFTLMAEYDGRLPLFHQDLYRLAGAEDAIQGGLLDERQEEGVTITEWADRLPTALDPGRLTIEIEVGNDDQRRITLRAAQAAHAGYLEAAARWTAGPDAGGQ